MNASATFENELLKLLFQNLDIANIGDAGGLRKSVNSGSLYLRLCTDATAVDDETMGAECAYTGYVAGGVAVARSADAWEVDGGEVWNLIDILFGSCTAGTENIRYVELWRNNVSLSEVGRIAWVQLDADLEVSAGITPKFSPEAIYFSFD